MKELRLDWRGHPDLSKPCDLYSVAATHTSRPVTGNPSGRILVGISPTILFDPRGDAAGTQYNHDLFAAADRLGAGTTRTVWQGENGYKTVLFDLTKRGMLKAWLEILDQHFPWADGFHCDYASAWSWLFPDMAETDSQWDSVLAAMFGHLRAKGKIVVAQNFHLTAPILASNGAFVEQSPYSFRYTLEQHAEDMTTMRNFTARVMPRESVWVYEIREWQNWPKASLDLVKKWLEDNDCYGCFGRDANVMP